MEDEGVGSFRSRPVCGPSAPPREDGVKLDEQPIMPGRLRWVTREELRIMTKREPRPFPAIRKAMILLGGVLLGTGLTALTIGAIWPGISCLACGVLATTRGWMDFGWIGDDALASPS